MIPRSIIQDSEDGSTIVKPIQGIFLDLQKYVS